MQWPFLLGHIFQEAQLQLWPISLCEKARGIPEQPSLSFFSSSPKEMRQKQQVEKWAHLSICFMFFSNVSLLIDLFLCWYNFRNKGNEFWDFELFFDDKLLICKNINAPFYIWKAKNWVSFRCEKYLTSVNVQNAFCNVSITLSKYYVHYFMQNYVSFHK